jgi:glycosyltransferase involved in cell wall biosynthesis
MPHFNTESVGIIQLNNLISAGHSLAIVMPVYNEEECIADVIRSWHDELCLLNIDFIMIVLNDGSDDETRHKLNEFMENERVFIIHKENTGHGPSILMGYHTAVEKATWVFQTDSDDSIKSRYFAELWNRRDDYDALFGIRERQQQNLARKIISIVSRITVRSLFGKGVTDVNIPFRLIRSDILKKIIEHIPDGTFAPNIIISGILSAAGLRIFNCSLLDEGRKTGSTSIVKWNLCKAAAQSLWQTIKFRSKLKKAAFHINTHHK